MSEYVHYMFLWLNKNQVDLLEGECKQLQKLLVRQLRNAFSEFYSVPASSIIYLGQIGNNIDQRLNA